MGGAARRRAVGRRRRLALGLPGATGAAWRVAARRGARGVVLQSGPKPWGPACRLGRAAAIRALWVRPVHARDVLDEMLWHVRGLQTTRKLAGWGYSLRQNHWTCWSGQGIKFTV